MSKTGSTCSTYDLCQRVLALISQRSGIRLLPHQSDGLGDTLAQLQQRFAYDTLQELVNALERDEDHAAFKLLVSEITIGESYFFRDALQINLLETHILPAIMARKRQTEERSIRVWSAGCSGGQELYTIAILLDRLMTDHPGWQCHLLGTDINQQAIHVARTAKYRDWSFRTTPHDVLQNYFSAIDEDGLRTISRHIRDKVQFGYLNLAEYLYPALENGTADLDLIICRNVFIYLQPEVIDAVMLRFAECLRPDGYLLLGVSDHVNLPEDVFAYRRTDAAGYLQKHARPPDAKIKVATAIDLPESVNSCTALDAAMAQLGLNTPATPPPRRPPIPAQTLPVASAQQLANRGEHAAALNAVTESIRQNPTDPAVHMLHGLILMESAAYDEAEAALRKALFLDHTNLDIHTHLGRLLIRIGKRDAGLRSLRNALQLATRDANTSENRVRAQMLQQEIDAILAASMAGNT